MKNLSIPILTIATLILTSCKTPSNTIALGEWTEDFGAAKTGAKKYQKPILLNFTGKEWCHGCEWFNTNVFTKAEWKGYARNELMLVMVDLKKEAFMDMRKADPETDALRIRYDIRGYPSFILLDSDGKTELGRLAGRRMGHMGEPTPENFQKWLRPFLHYHSPEIARVAASMPQNSRKTYLELAEQREELMREFRKVSTTLAEMRREGWYIKAEAREKKWSTAEEWAPATRQLNQIKERFNRTESELFTIWDQKEGIEREMRSIRVLQLSRIEQQEYEKLVPQVKKASRFQGNKEDKETYRKLENKMLQY